MIAFLQDFREKEQQLVTSNDELEKYRSLAESLELKNQQLIKENELLKKELKALKDDYIAMLSIMEKARKLAIKEEENNVRMKFQMDTNGNVDIIKNE